MKFFLIAGAVNGLLSVALGAFGAHMLEGRVADKYLETWQTAVQYQMFHSIGLIAVAILMSSALLGPLGSLSWAGYLMLAGIDPVMACKGEDEVLFPENVDAMIKYLLPHAKVVTPNLVEAGQLSGLGVLQTVEDLQKAAEKIHAHGAKFVVIKGGKQLKHEKAADLLFDGDKHYLLTADKTDTTYNHGAGCTFAAAITANLANGQSVKDAVYNAKIFVSTAIAHGWKLNEYVGPVMHGAANKFQKAQVEVVEL